MSACINECADSYAVRECSVSASVARVLRACAEHLRLVPWKSPGRQAEDPSASDQQLLLGHVTNNSRLFCHADAKGIMPVHWLCSARDISINCLQVAW